MNSGIYKIANTVNEGIYIGSSINIEKRFIQRKSALKSNKHSNCILQNFVNKYGLQTLIFEVVENVGNKNKLISREQFYINKLQPKYNILPLAGRSTGYKHTLSARNKISDAGKNRKFSEEHKNKISESKRGLSYSEEHKEKISMAQRGNKNSFYGNHHSIESKEKISKTKSQPFRIASPEGEVFETQLLNEFCRRHGLHAGCISQVIHSNRRSHKGWTKA